MAAEKVVAFNIAKGNIATQNARFGESIGQIIARTPLRCMTADEVLFRLNKTQG